jgi:hypothetical protein
MLIINNLSAEGSVVFLERWTSFQWAVPGCLTYRRNTNPRRVRCSIGADKSVKNERTIIIIFYYLWGGTESLGICSSP